MESKKTTETRLTEVINSLKGCSEELYKVADEKRELGNGFAEAKLYTYCDYIDTTVRNIEDFWERLTANDEAK